MAVDIGEFMVAGASLDWPMGTGAGLTNHPDMEVVARNIEYYCGLGLPEVVAGGYKLGDAHGGNGYVKLPSGLWEYIGGDEYPDEVNRAGYNAKGLPGPGLSAVVERASDLLEIANNKAVELSVNISPHTPEPLSEMDDLFDTAEKLLKAGFLRVEFNLSCPNIPDRPPFYLDTESVNRFVEIAGKWRDRTRNKNNLPGIYPKFGPMGTSLDEQELRKFIWQSSRYGTFGGVVTSNTLGGQEPKLDSGEPAILANGGKAGKSGPAMRDEGMRQLSLWLTARDSSVDGELVSSLGVLSGENILNRLATRNGKVGAAFCQLTSVLYWPGLVEHQDAQGVVNEFKNDIVAQTS